MKIVAGFGGGHVMPFPAALYGLADEAFKRGHELFVSDDGWYGAISNRVVPVTRRNLDYLVRPDRALIVSGSPRYKLKTKDQPKYKDLNPDDVDAIVSNFAGKDVVVVWHGGDDNLGELLKLKKAGLKVMGWDKTMDNDKDVPLVCFGYHSFIAEAVKQMLGARDQAYTNRSFVWHGVFARDTDFVPAQVAYTGMADLMIGGEGRKGGIITLDTIAAKVAEVLDTNERKYGKRFGTGICSEGAVNVEGYKEFLEAIIKGTENHRLKFKIEFDPKGHPKLQPELLSIYLSMAVSQLLKAKGQYINTTYQGRNGCPTEFDATYGQEAGREIVRGIEASDFGTCAVVDYDPAREQGKEFFTRRIPLEQASRKRTLEQVSTARGITPVDYSKLCVTEDMGKLYPMLFTRPEDKPGKEYMPICPEVVSI